MVLTGLLAWYFFGPKKSRQAELADGVQIIKVTVKGGYSPDVIQVATGVPVRLLFDRQESGDCSSRVVFPDFKVNRLFLRSRPPRSSSCPRCLASTSSRAG